MRIEQLEYAAAVARFGSFRRAAEELHISQPALSETVRKLEVELGVNLLDRQRTGATVSAEGRELLPHLLDVVEAARRLRYAADEQHESSRTVRLGTVSAATSPLLTATIRAFRDTWELGVHSYLSYLRERLTSPTVLPDIEYHHTAQTVI